MRPLRTQQLTAEKRIFNYRGRKTVENAFGIMPSCFRVFRRPLAVKRSTADEVVKASLTIEIGDVKKDEARKGDAKTSTTQTTMDSAGKLNDSKNYNTQYRLSGQALPWLERRFCV